MKTTTTESHSNSCFVYVLAHSYDLGCTKARMKTEP